MEEELAIDAPAATTSYYKRIAGSDFHPLGSFTDHSPMGAGCVYRTSVGGRLSAGLQLPQGAVLDYLRIYFYDNSTEEIDVVIWAHDGAHNESELISVTSTGSQGYDSAGAWLDPAHVVDNVSEALSIVVGFGNSTNIDTGFCRVRVRYQFSLDQAYLPTVLHTARP
ncbi:hypothetical protein ACFLWA_03255 [Chloroflexota bacterium]